MPSSPTPSCSVGAEWHVTDLIQRGKQIGLSLVEILSGHRALALTSSARRARPTDGFPHALPTQGPQRRALKLFSSSSRWDGSRQALDLYICHISLLINAAHLPAVAERSANLQSERAEGDRNNPELWTPHRQMYRQRVLHCTTNINERREV